MEETEYCQHCDDFYLMKFPFKCTKCAPVKKKWLDDVLIVIRDLESKGVIGDNMLCEKQLHFPFLEKKSK